MPLRTLATVETALAWWDGSGVTALATDSRRVVPGAAFIAWPGYAVDGRGFVAPALAAGAAVCLVEADGADGFDFGGDDRVAGFAGLKAATGELASEFMGRPSEALDVIAVTGTNGKTSVAWWVAQALGVLGRRCGVIGTLGIGEPPSAIVPTGMTTPDPVTVQAGFKQFVEAGVQACAIEATSIGLVEQRLAGTAIDVALFTNFTQDHLDFHADMAAYWQAKAALFDWPGLRAAVINIDDEHGAGLAQALSQRNGPALWTYSSRSGARLRAVGLRYENAGLAFELHESSVSVAVTTRLIGDYNVANLLAVIGGLRALGVPLVDAARACADLTPVPGRMQRVGVPADVLADAPQVVVDYAHTPDALEKALLALTPFARERDGELWCVFGCGGNRDTAKRPLMGALADRLASRVIVTSDNPRLEAPEAILAQIVAGITRPVEVIENRAAAIVRAVSGAGSRDVILIAGKGHEACQDVAGVKHPFSDVAHALTALQQRGQRA